MRKFGREGQRSRMRKGIRWQNLKAFGWKSKELWQTLKIDKCGISGLGEVEFGIGSSGMKYAEWNYRGVSEVSGKTELKPRRYGWKKEFFFQEGICNGVKVIGNKWICNGMELTGNSSGQRKSAIVQLKIDMDPRYVASYRFKGITQPPMLSSGLRIGAVPLTPRLK